MSTEGTAARVIPGQVAAGTVDLWPVLRDPEAAAAAERGELDPILVELHAMARSHADHRLIEPLRARAAVLGLALDSSDPPAPVDPKPFTWRR